MSAETPTAWASALIRVPDDVQGEARQKLLAYLLALALARPTRGDRMSFLIASPFATGRTSKAWPQNCSETRVFWYGSLRQNGRNRKALSHLPHLAQCRPSTIGIAKFFQAKG
jgi:hypothetical protein